MLDEDSRIVSDNVPVVVYQMGKVGSMSVVSSLQDSGVEPVYHVHAMNPEQEMPQEAAGVVYRDIIRRGRRARFVTLVREPVARNVSAFFQEENFIRHTGRTFAASGLSLQELARIFGAKLSHMGLFPLTWFDRQVKPILGIDVYAHDFPREAGFASISAGPYDLLLLKCELDDAVKAAAIADFLSLDTFRIERSNVGVQKDYAELYRRFRDSVRLPESHLEAMLSSRYTRHFYAPQEIERFRCYWSDPGRCLPVLADGPAAPSPA